MSRPPRICVVGSANIDLTYRASRLPSPGETLRANDFRINFGGKGANQAVMAARLGASVTLIARVGDDAFGTQTIDSLRRQGIDTTCVGRVTDCATGSAAIVVDD